MPIVDPGKNIGSIRARRGLALIGKAMLLVSVIKELPFW